jgi:acyl-CoA thioesterase
MMMQTGEFHWRDGVFFSRDEHGRVHVRIDRGPKVESPDARPEDRVIAQQGWTVLPERATEVVLCIPPNEWASIVAHVARGNGSVDAYGKASALHGPSGAPMWRTDD